MKLWLAFRFWLDRITARFRDARSGFPPPSVSWSQDFHGNFPKDMPALREPAPMVGILPGLLLALMLFTTCFATGYVGIHLLQIYL